MVKIKRIGPEEHVTLEITAPKEAWQDLTDYLGKNDGNGPSTFCFLDPLRKEFPRLQ